jgi:hypothetical protein
LAAFTINIAESNFRHTHQHGQNEAHQRDHRVNLADSIAQ